jgi:hypothetical protein
VAIPASVFTPTSDDTEFALAASTASAEQAAGGGLIEITANGPVNIVFGQPGNVPTPTASNYLIPANTPRQFALGTLSSFKVYNSGASSANVYWTRLAQA